MNNHCFISHIIHVDFANFIKNNYFHFTTFHDYIFKFGKCFQKSNNNNKVLLHLLENMFDLKSISVNPNSNPKAQ